MSSGECSHAERGYSLELRNDAFPEFLSFKFKVQSALGSCDRYELEQNPAFQFSSSMPATAKSPLRGTENSRPTFSQSPKRIHAREFQGGCRNGLWSPTACGGSAPVSVCFSFVSVRYLAQRFVGHNQRWMVLSIPNSMASCPQWLFNQTERFSSAGISRA